MSQSVLALSKAFETAFTTSNVYNTTFNPSRFSMTAWNTTTTNVGIRVFGATPDRHGILELGVDYTVGATVPWHATVQLFGSVTTAPGSDFAAASAPGGGQISVFFVLEDGMLAHSKWSNTGKERWLPEAVYDAVPTANTSLAAAMWASNHMSVFYQDAAGAIFESELANGEWQMPQLVTTARMGTDINAVRASDSAGLVKVVYVQDGIRVTEYTLSTQAGSTWTKTVIAAFPEHTENVRFSVSYSDISRNPGHIYYASNNGNGTIGELRGSVGHWEPFYDIPYLSNTAADSDISASLLFPGKSNWVWHVYTATDGTLWCQTYAQSPAKWRSPVQLVPSSA